MSNQSFWVRLNVSLSPVIVLLLLVWIAPAVSEPTSYNDPFRAIVLHTPKPADPPICCLRPLPPLEPVEDDLRLSFEEWKAKQQHPGSENISETTNTSTGNSNARGSANESESTGEGTASAVADHEDTHIPVVTTQETPIELAPHARIPLNDRFNYASLDCSARVHAAHKSAKHSSNVLSSKKDRYMLSPCKTKGEKQYVIIELCEDIRIDTVQMANFEFFSGVFKDFTVSVAKRYDEESFVYAGTYRAKNVRGVQSFHPTLRDFYRFLRIDFLSHYGSEYYCPVSLLRVYGLTHLEEWKWELWEAESKIKTQAALQEALDHPPGEVLPALGTINDTAFSTQAKEVPSEKGQPPITSHSPVVSEEVKQGETLSVSTHINDILTPTNAYVSPSTSSEPLDSQITHAHTVTVTSLTSIIPASSADLSIPASSPLSTASNASIAPSKVMSMSDDLNATGTTMSTIISSLSPSPPPINATPIPSRPSSLSPNPTGGSIYRTFMNRLGELESKHTLFEKYVGQQQSLVREALIRSSEDVGRLEGMGKAQRQALDRAAHEWEKQRKQWQMEHAQLLQRVEFLSEEIIMEKRLGVAQLCLLLAVLVFISLTRGSRGPVVDDRRQWRKALSFGSLSEDLRNLRRRESDNVRPVKRDDGRHEIPKNAEVITVVETGKTLSESVDVNVSTSQIYPLPSVTLNTPPSRHGKDEENRRPEQFEEDYFHTGSTSTPPRNRTRTISRTRSRTSSATKGVFSQGSYFINGAGTPSKGSRSAGVYSIGRPSNLASMRANTAIPPHFKRPLPLQRSHSTHASTMAGEYMSGTGWTVSGNTLKSTRKWASTAHLHEVKVRRRENEKAAKQEENAYGEGEGDVFSDKSNISNPQPWTLDTKERERPMTLILKSEDTDVDADGWEDASDVGVDAMDEI